MYTAKLIVLLIVPILLFVAGCSTAITVTVTPPSAVQTDAVKTVTVTAPSAGQTNGGVQTVAVTTPSAGQTNAVQTVTVSRPTSTVTVTGSSNSSTNSIVTSQQPSTPAYLPGTLRQGPGLSVWIVKYKPRLCIKD
jgi:hypothetical protein